MYYIYHIPGVKIGCTNDLTKRMKDQGFDQWEILEQYEDGWHAGNREIELQKEYGYPVDKVHYMISKQHRMKGRPIGFKHSKETRRKIGDSHKGLKHSEEHRHKISLGGKGLSKPKSPQHIENHRNALKNIPKLECSICGKIIGGGRGNLTQHLNAHKKKGSQ